MWSSWRLPTTYSWLLRLTTGHSAQGSSGCWSLLIWSAMEMRKNKEKRNNKSQSQNMSCLVGLRLTQGLTAFCGVYEQITGCLLIIWLSGSNNMPKFLQLCPCVPSSFWMLWYGLGQLTPCLQLYPSVSQTETWQSCSSVSSIVSFTLLLHSKHTLEGLVRHGSVSEPLQSSVRL